MKKFLFIICIVGMFCQNTFSQDLTIKKYLIDPIIDGSLDNWFTILNEVNYKMTTTQNLTAKFQLFYTCKYLYLIVEVEGWQSLDTSSATIPNAWERDNVEIYFKFDTSLNKTGITPIDKMFRLQRASTIAYEFDKYYNSKALDSSVFKIGQSDDGNNTIQEWRFPWKAIQTHQYEFRNFRFGTSISDNTTGLPEGVKQQVFWKNKLSRDSLDARHLSVIGLDSWLDPDNCLNNINDDIFIKKLYQDRNSIRNVSAKKGFVSVYDITGHTIMQRRVQNNSINVSGLKTGLYFIENEKIMFIEPQ